MRRRTHARIVIRTDGIERGFIGAARFQKPRRRSDNQIRLNAALGTNQQEVSVKRHFDAHSDEWESIYARRDQHALTIQRRHRTTMQFVMSLGLPPDAQVLDLGCGTGTTSTALAERGFQVVGSDVSEHMLDRARANCARRGLLDRVSFRIGDAEALESPDEVFDLVIAMGLIEYLRWDRWALQEMGRVLKPGGHLIVTVPNRDRLSFRVSRVTAKLEDRVAYYMSRVRIAAGFQPRALDGSTPHGGATDPQGFSRRLYSPAGLKEKLTALDYEIVKSVSHGFGPFGPLARSRSLSMLADRTLELCKNQLGVGPLAEAGSNYMVLCRKPSSLNPFESEGASNRLEMRVAQFELNEKPIFAQRDVWLTRHPEFRPTAVRKLNRGQGCPERVLVLAPHPDDEIIGCGGTLGALIEAGASVSVLYLTDGTSTTALNGAPTTAKQTIRLREAEQVADEMGFADAITWGHAEEDLVCDLRSVDKLRGVLERIFPDLIFVPFVNDPHPAHRMANRLLAAALEGNSHKGESRIAGYEVWSLVPANLICTIDDQWPMKSRMLMRYRTAMKTVDYVRRCRVQAAYHARTLLGRRGLVESFLELPAAAYRELVRDMMGDSTATSGVQTATNVAEQSLGSLTSVRGQNS